VPHPYTFRLHNEPRQAKVLRRKPVKDEERVGGKTFPFPRRVLTINIELEASRVARNRIIDPADEDFSSIFGSDLSQKNGSHMS